MEQMNEYPMPIYGRPMGHRVVFDGDEWSVLRYEGAHSWRVAGPGIPEADAHALAERMSSDWRARTTADLDHWEAVWRHEQQAIRQAEDAGLTYRYVPWYEARSDRSLIGQVATVAYWVHERPDLPWGHQHPHRFAYAFERVTGLDSDWLALERRGSQQMITYDTICVQERTA